jgi:DNA-binding beta-propeller fold protein YncE
MKQSSSIRSFAAVVLLAGVGVAHAQKIALSPGSINVVAGTTSGTTGSNGVGTSGTTGTGTTNGLAGVGATAATTSKVSLPFSVKVDSSGDVFWIDSTTNTIRVLYEGGTAVQSLIAAYSNPTLTVGNVYTIAGTGSSGTGADKIAANTTTFNAPRGLFVDSSGNIYIADSGNVRVRMIYVAGTAAAALISEENSSTTATSGYIYTIAGGCTSSCPSTGLATAQLFASAQPRGLYVDASGDVYIADNGSNRLKLIYNGGSVAACQIMLQSPTTYGLSTGATSSSCASATSQPTLGYMYVIAGNGTTTEMDGTLATANSVNGPADISLDSAGNEYIAEFGASKIRKITYTTGKISTLAGTGSIGSTPADPQAASGALLNTPRGLALDDATDIYIADTANSRIRRIDGATESIISTVAGPVSGLSNGSTGDGGNANSALLNASYEIALDPSGNIFIADEATNKIRKVNVTSGIFTFPTNGTGSIEIGGVSSQLATILNTGASPLTLSGITFTGAFSQTATTGTDCTSSTTLAAGAYCNLQITFAPTATGSVTGTLAITSNGVNNGGNVNANLYGIGTATAVATTTTVTYSPSTEIGANTNITFTATVASTSSGSPATGTVAFTMNSGATTLCSAATVTNGVATCVVQLAVGASQTVTAAFSGITGFNASSGTASVTVLAGTTTTVSASPTTADTTASVTLTANVTSTTPGTIAGTVTFYSGSTSVGSTTTITSGVATINVTTLPSGTDSITAVYSGNASYGASTSSIAATVIISPQNIWVVNGNTTLSELGNTGAAVSSTSGYAGGGAGIAIDSSGNVYSANTTGNSVTRFNSLGTVGATFTAGGLNGPVALAVSGTSYIWVANSTGNSLSLFNSSGTAYSPVTTGLTGGSMSTPSALAIDTAGNLWVANSGNSSVTEFIGAADPVVTPLATASKNVTQGTKP